MQDKEFDQLFKDQFDQAEIQPSRNLWEDISSELVPKKKRNTKIYWSAAAAVFIVSAIGVLYPKTEKIQLYGVAKPIEEELAVPSKPQYIVEEKSQVAERSTPLILAPKLELENDGQINNFNVLQPNDANVHPIVKRSEGLALIKEELIKAEVQVSDVHSTKNDASLIAEPEIQLTAVKERKGIRNMGDVINFVVDKLDKREKKIIQFKTDDDDNSSLIALNIGILKFNPKKDSDN